MGREEEVGFYRQSLRQEQKGRLREIRAWNLAARGHARSNGSNSCKDTFQHGIFIKSTIWVGTLRGAAHHCISATAPCGICSWGFVSGGGAALEEGFVGFGRKGCISVEGGSTVGSKHWRQLGHVLCWVNHWSMHSLWNSCSQGRLRIISPSSYSHMHMAHVISAPLKQRTPSEKNHWFCSNRDNSSVPLYSAVCTLGHFLWCKHKIFDRF